MENARAIRLTSLSFDTEGCLSPIEAKWLVSAKIRAEGAGVYIVEHKGPIGAGEPRAKLERHYLLEEEERLDGILVRRWRVVGLVTATRGNRLGGAFRLAARPLVDRAPTDPGPRRSLPNPHESTDSEALSTSRPPASLYLAELPERPRRRES